MKNKKYLITRSIVPIALASVLLAGCGHTAHHAEKKPEKTKTIYVIHKPKHDKDVKPDKTDRKNADSTSKQKPNKKQDQLKHLNKQVDHIKKTDPDLNGLPAVQLGNGAVAHEDDGAGQKYVVFNLGRWTVNVHGNDVNQDADTARNEAEHIDNWAQSHTLPIPRTHGELDYDASSGTATATWNGHTLHGTLAQVLSEASK